MLYDTLKDFQSVLGFVGVIITLAWNARMAHVASLKQIAQTRLTMQTALRQELQSIREELNNVAAELNRKPANPFVFTLEEPYVYRTLVKEIGVLEPEQARIVIRTHRDLYLLLKSIRELAADPSKAIATMDPENFGEAEEYVLPALNEIDQAIKALAG